MKEKEKLIDILWDYHHMGFQTYQAIPEQVWEAYQRLVELGYTMHLI